MRSLLCVSGAAALVLFTAAAPAGAEETGPDQDFTLQDTRITESSGLAASRAHPGVYWTHNDQDQPRVFAVDSRTGKTVATITLSGVGTPRDMEAISVGPDGNVYVGDIGDNLDGSWDHVWIYRFPEPKTLKDQTVRATQYDVKYADGPRNAEALMVHPKTGRVYIASKKEDGGGLYEGPAKLSTKGTNTFRRIAEVPWVTDGAFSPDGKELLLRGYLMARAYEWKDGRPGEDRSVGAPFQGQAESASYTLDGSAAMFGSEGTGSKVLRVDLGDRPDGSGGPKSPATSAPPKGGGADAGGQDGEKGNFGLGVVVLAVATAAVVGFKRLLRRGD
ncbi:MULTISPECIES: YncE family protein [Streptomyces]|uniref:WD40 repeat domain-containing protein n=1 Tax=Streptomyces solicathayae TaxID=3081768 RepID=A0ABZ0LY21_9ACTN|nr:WD40 repeat domain-containing protein [Streptomyces sp. HUAS YS2]WOX23698.1 WD40 repeat domain-containing protein [Streptomyces sp. HUAS YS2]